MPRIVLALPSLLLLLPLTVFVQRQAEHARFVSVAVAHARSVVGGGPLHLSSDGWLPSSILAARRAAGASVGPPFAAVECRGPFGRCKAAPARVVVELAEPE